MTPGASKKMLRADGSKRNQEQSVETAQHRAGAGVLGCMGSPLAWGPCPKGTRQSPCQHRAELLVDVKAEEQLDVVGFR